MDKWEVFNERHPIGLAPLHKLLAQIVQYAAAAARVELKLHEICPWLSPDP